MADPIMRMWALWFPWKIQVITSSKQSACWPGYQGRRLCSEGSRTLPEGTGIEGSPVTVQPCHIPRLPPGRGQIKSELDGECSVGPSS